MIATIDNMVEKKVAASLRHDADIMRRSVEQLLDATKWDIAKLVSMMPMIYYKAHMTLFLSLLRLQSSLVVMGR